MPRYWHPDEKFLEFLEFLSKRTGQSVVVNGRNIISEMRDGTDTGRGLYDALYGDPILQEGYEAWKSMQKP